MLKSAEPLLLVGAGKMGGAMLDGWLERGLDAARSPSSIRSSMPDRRAALEQAGATVATEPAASCRPRTTGLLRRLAVKPQTMADVLPAVAPLAGPETVDRLDRRGRAAGKA